MSIFSSLFGRQAKASSDPDQPTWELPLGAGVIQVQKGSIDKISRAIKSHSELYRVDDPTSFSLTVAKNKTGGFVVRLPQGTPPYEICNLISWLDANPEIKGLSKAKGWFRSPETGIEYSLQADTNNPRGDTLVGAGSDGTSVQVYLPDLGVCSISQKQKASVPPPPSADIESTLVTVEMVIEVNPEFGNPQFVLTHPENTNW